MTCNALSLAAIADDKQHLLRSRGGYHRIAAKLLKGHNIFMFKQIIKILEPLHRGLRVRLIVYGQTVERKAAHFGMIVRLCWWRVHLTTVL